MKIRQAGVRGKKSEQQTASKKMFEFSPPTF
jgi:hypothetical protein